MRVGFSNALVAQDVCVSFHRANRSVFPMHGPETGTCLALIGNGQGLKTGPAPHRRIFPPWRSLLP